MRPYGMKKKPETTAYVKKFIADMNHVGPPLCFRTDNGGEFTSRSYIDSATPLGSAANTQPRVSQNRTQLSRVQFCAL